MGSDRRRRLPLEGDRALAFVVAGAAPFALAVQGGGYDLVAGQLTSLVVWWVLAAGLALGLLPRSRQPRTLRLAAVGAAALAGWTAASLLWTSSAEATFAELGRVIGYAGVAALVLATVHRSNWRAGAAGVAAAAVAVSLLALASRVAPAPFAGTSAAVVIDGRLGYPLGYWNAVGAWGVMALALSLGWTGERQAPVARRLALAVAPAIGLSVYLTYSRGALIGLAVAAACMFAVAGDRRELATNVGVAAVATIAAILIARTQPAIIHGSGGEGGGFVLAALIALGAMSIAFADALARRRERLEPWRPPTLIATLAAAAVLVAGAALLAPRSLPPRVATTPHTVQAPAVTDPASRIASLQSSRLVIWRQAVDAFASSPVLGIGPGTFQFWWNEHEGSPALRDAHSVYLEMLAELGIPGLAALAVAALGLLLTAVVATVPRRPGALAAGLLAAFVAFCVQAGGDWLWKIPAVVALAVTAVGVAIASAAWARPGASLPAAARAAAAAAALLAGALLVPGIVSTQLARDSATLLAAGEPRRAGDYARAAITAEPWSASAHAQLALAEQGGGQLVAATADARRAIDLEPDNWTNRVLLGTIDYQAGRRAAALARFRQAARLDSRDPSQVTAALLHRKARAGGFAP